MTRMVDTIMLIPILLQLKPKLKHLPPIGIGFFISVMPQLINQFLTYRSIFTNPYLTGANGIWQFNLIHLFEHLFSQKRGLFLWSPIFLLGFWGLIKSKSKIFIASIIILWLVSSSWSAFSSAGYGQRFSFCAIPLFSFGLAFLINRWKLKKILTVFLVFSFLNINLLSTFYLHKDKLVQDSNLSLHEFIDLQIKNPAQVLNYIKVAITNGRIVQ
jgi:hypothetical protein